MTKLPPILYFALGNYGAALNTTACDIGALDPVENLDDAADALIEVETSTGLNGRVLAITFCLTSNMPEAVSDVTEECVAIVHRRQQARGIAAE